MKKIILNLLFVCLSISGFSQSYQTALKKLNDYLKTFDNGYYGYLEVKDGYLYDRFKDGKNYCKALIKDIDKAEEVDYKRKVSLKCKSYNSCVYSTYTSSNHESFSFSQSSDFNTSELITLLNNLISSYNNTSSSSDDLDKYKSNIDIMNSGSTQTSGTTTTKSANSNTDSKAMAEKALKELNEYMVTLDNGRYKGMEVTNGYIIQNYEKGQSSKAKIEDIDRVEINTEYNYAKLACKGNSKCVYSTITGSYHDYFNFNTSGKSLTKMQTLLKNFLTALKKANGQNVSSSSSTTPTVKTDAQKLREQKEKERQKSDSKTEDVDDFWGTLFEEVTPLEKSTTANPSKYTKPLNDLNAYLKTFNSATYGDVEVKGSDVIFNFKFSSQKFSSSIRITELVQNTIVIKGKSAGTFGTDEIKILCKNESKCFYSTYSKSTTDHFRFFSNTVKDLTKMEQLVNAFVNSLK